MDIHSFLLCESVAGESAGGGRSDDSTVGAVVGVAEGRQSDEAIVTLQGDGVVTYSSRTKVCAFGIYSGCFEHCKMFEALNF